MVTVKFGGSSIADAGKLINTVKIIREKAAKTRVFVVYSAVYGMTDSFVKMVSQATLAEATTELVQLQQRYEKIIEQLCEPLDDTLYYRLVDQLGSRLSQVKVWLAQCYQSRQSDAQIRRNHNQIMTTGERLSVDITLALSEAMGLKVAHLDAGEVILLRQGRADMATSGQALANKLAQVDDDTQVCIMEGFYGRNEAGDIETLGRNASDLSAVLLGHLSASSQIEIYSDQDGICIADPRLIYNPAVFSRINFSQARMISQLGASIIHRDSISNHFAMNIPVWIKNSHRPELPGTLIDVDSEVDDEASLKAMCCMFEVAVGKVDNQYMMVNRDAKKCNDEQVCDIKRLIYQTGELEQLATSDEPLSMLSFTGLSSSDERMLCMSLDELALGQCLVFNGHFKSVCSVVVPHQQVKSVARRLFDANPHFKRYDDPVSVTLAGVAL